MFKTEGERSLGLMWLPFGRETDTGRQPADATGLLPKRRRAEFPLEEP